ncbi:MAG TPA: hypothetical protein VH852_05405 [Hyphomicrobium sp.]|jgi:hypothetical protein
MKFAVKSLSVLAAAGLLMGTMAATPASAGDKCAWDGDLVKLVDADLKRLDKELFGWMKR